MRNIHTSAQDWRDAANFLGELALADSLAELDEFVPVGLRRLFHADLVVWERLTDDLCQLVYRVLPAPRVALAALHPAFLEHFPEHPAFPRLREGFDGGLTFILSDFGATRRFLQTGLWREVYLHLLAKHQLGVGGRIDRRTVFLCGMNRLIGDYGPRDRELARFLQPQISRGAGAVRRRESARSAAQLLSRFFLHREAPFALIAANGRILEISASARALLARVVPGGLPDPGRVPEACGDLLGKLRERPTHGTKNKGGFALVSVGTAARALVLRPGDHEEATVIFEAIAPDEKGETAPRLSRREAETLAWLGEGKTNTEIAAVLGISPRTVEKHCERLFAKLGVENRLAAALLARR